MLVTSQIIILTAITPSQELNRHRSEWISRGGGSRLRWRKGSFDLFSLLPNNSPGFPQISFNCFMVAQESRQKKLVYSFCVDSCFEDTEPKHACWAVQCSASDVFNVGVMNHFLRFCRSTMLSRRPLFTKQQLVPSLGNLDESARLKKFGDHRKRWTEYNAHRNSTSSKPALHLSGVGAKEGQWLRARTHGSCSLTVLWSLSPAGPVSDPCQHQERPMKPFSLLLSWEPTPPLLALSVGHRHLWTIPSYSSLKFGTSWFYNE